jgi:hypothetical protein
LNGNERDKTCLAAIEQAEMVRPIFLLGCTSERVRRVIAGNDPEYFHLVDQYVWKRLSDPDVRELRSIYGGTAIYGAYMTLYYRGRRRLTPIAAERRA